MSTEREQELGYIARRAEAISWLYTESGNRYEKINAILSITLVVGSYLFGSTGIPTIFAGSWEHMKYVNLALHILMLAIGALGTAIKIFGFDKKIQTYTTAAYRYSEIFVDINKELGKPQSARIDPDIFYERITTDVLDLGQTRLRIPGAIEKKYRKTFTNAIPYGDLWITPLARSLAESDTESVDLNEFVARGWMQKSQAFFFEIIKRI